MVHYLFNNNKPLKMGKKPHFFIVHYCDKCNSYLVGEWKEDNINSATETEIADFDKLKICPICNSKLSTKKFYHFCNGQVLKHENVMRKNTKQNNITYSLNTESQFIFRSAINETRAVPKEEYVYISELSSGDSDSLETGSKVFTEKGVGIVSRIVLDEGANVVYHEGTIDSIIAYFERYVDTERKEYAEEKINAFINKYNINNSNDFETRIQLDDKEKLKEYLKNIMDIEKNIFSLTERLKNLYYLNCSAGKDAIASEKKFLLDFNIAVLNAKKKCNELKSRKVEKEINIEDFSISLPEKPQKPTKPKEPVLAKPGLFNRKKVLAENAALTEKYEKDLEGYELAKEKYSAALKEYKQKVNMLEKQRENDYAFAIEAARENLEKDIVKAKTNYEELVEKQEQAMLVAKDKPTPEKAKHVILKEEIKNAEVLLKKYYEAKDKLYSYGVLFGKYRNFVAVSSLYEYLSSGRCDSLEGAHGAYNLYENEIRMNMVICQLNQVIESLEEIKQNQYMIYSAIKESNVLLGSLNSSTYSAMTSLKEIKTRATTMESYMSKIADNTQVIAYNTERTAFYSKKNAELTNALGFMVALK